MTRAAVYKHYDANNSLLYVGCTTKPEARIAQHGYSSPWAKDSARVDYKWFSDLASALKFERAEIMRTKAPHNKQWRHWIAPRYSANEGHVYLTQWMESTGVTVSDFADRINVSVAEAKKLCQGPIHIQTLKAHRICGATCGYVPIWAWKRRYPSRLSEAPMIKRMAAKDAAKSLSEVVGLRPHEIWTETPRPVYRLRINEITDGAVPPESWGES